MRKKTASTFTLVAAMTLLIAVFVFMSFYAGGLNLPVNTASMFLGVMPGVFIFFVGITSLWWAKVSLFALPGFAVLGIGVAILLGEIESTGLYPIVGTGDVTIAQFQWIIIILCTMIGAVVAAGSRR